MGGRIVLWVKCKLFLSLLSCLPHEKELWQKFGTATKDPLILFEREFSRNSRWKCFQHGDSWHNNFLFDKTNLQEAFVIDWQVCEEKALKGLVLVVIKSTQSYKSYALKGILIQLF